MGGSVTRLSLLCALALPVLARAQNPGTIPWFDRGTSPIALERRRAPQRVPQRPSAGEASPWAPKTAASNSGRGPSSGCTTSSSRSAFPSTRTPIPGRDVARSVIVRPEGFTIEYAYETFTVKQHVFTPIDQPAVIMLLEVDAIRPMEIIASFVPDMHLRVARLARRAVRLVESAAEGVHLLREPPQGQRIPRLSRRDAGVRRARAHARRRAAAVHHRRRQRERALHRAQARRAARRQRQHPHGVHPHHPRRRRDAARFRARALRAALRARRREARMGPTRGARRFHPAVARCTSSRRDAMLESRRRVGEGEPRRVDGLQSRPGLRTRRGLRTVRRARATVPASAGSSAATRPSTRSRCRASASTTSCATACSGSSRSTSAPTARSRTRSRRARGRSTGSARIRTRIYHGDTSPFWILAFGEYWKQSADTALVRELWPNVKKAYEWSRKTDTDGDGLMENTSAGAGALEVGALQEGIVSDVYMSGVWAAALERFARMAEVMGEPPARRRSARRPVRRRSRRSKRGSGCRVRANTRSRCSRAARSTRTSPRGRRRRCRSTCSTACTAPT